MNEDDKIVAIFTKEGYALVFKCWYLAKGLDLEEVRLLVLPLGHVNGDELEVDVFLKETG